MSVDAIESLFREDIMGPFLAKAMGVSGLEPPDSLPLRILGLDDLPSRRDVIKTAFRQRLLESHPDVAPTDMIGWGVLGHESDVQEIVWARDVLFGKVKDVTDSNGHAGVTLSTRNETPETVRKYPGAAALDSRHTFTLAERIVKELHDRPADWWNPRWRARPVTPEEWLEEERTQIRVRAERTAELCGNCGRDLGPMDLVLRDTWRPHVKCVECAGKHGSNVKPADCHGCGRPTRDLRPRPYVWDEELRHSGKRSFCCGRCQSAFYRRRQQQRRAEERAAAGPFRCQVCEEIMDGQRADARYCSPACRQRAYRSRKSA